MWIFGEVPFGTVVNFRSHPPSDQPNPRGHHYQRP